MKPVWLILWLSLGFGTPLTGNAQHITHRVLLQTSPLAGYQFHAGKRFWNDIKVGDPLTLTREPDNPYDSNAVRVEWKQHKIGYVPRAENDAVARQMDRGTRLEARITRLVESRNPWERIRFDVYIAPAE